VPGAGPAMTTPPLARLVAGEDGENLRRLPSPLAFNKSTSTEPASRLETGAWSPEARGWTLEARRQGPASADRARCHRARCHRPPRLPIMPPASRAWSLPPPSPSSHHASRPSGLVAATALPVFPSCLPPVGPGRCHRPPRLPIMPPARRAWSVFPPAHPRPSPPGQTPHPSVRVRVTRPG